MPAALDLIYQESLYRSEILLHTPQFSEKSLRNSPEMYLPLIEGRNVAM